MLFRVEDNVWERFPELVLGLVWADGIDNTSEAEEVSVERLRLQDRIRERFEGETLSQQPRIQAWRRAYSLFGAKPKKYLSSVESLYRMTLKGLDLRPISPVVDIYNLISLKHMVPVGGDDLDRAEGDIRLARAQGGETFIPLNSDKMETAKPGEIVYRDDAGVLCRRWNWRECDRTKMRPDTRRVCLVVEGLPPIRRGDMELIKDDLTSRIAIQCGGRLKSTILDTRHRTAALEF
jgi:DNA/RNA-binding domain of Phe-tRNA-synthetase-like protein